MRERRPGRVRGLPATIALIGLAFCPAAGAAEEKKELTPMEQLQKNLLGMQHNITASNVKLERRPIGAANSAPETAVGREPTPAETCCISHVDRINLKIRSINEIADWLDPWYAEQDHAEALEALDQIRSELKILARGIAVFRMAGSTRRAGEALQGLIRPFNRLRTAIDGLEQCCPLEKTADGNWKAKAPVR